MTTKIFVNLPVKNLNKSVEFFTQLGSTTFNPQFTVETATCMIVAEDIFVMLLTEAMVKVFLCQNKFAMPQNTQKCWCA